MSYTTRDMPFTSLIMRFDTLPKSRMEDEPSGRS